MSKDALDYAFALVEAAAAKGARCPQNREVGSGAIPELARQGKILIEISSRNYRTVTIIVGPHAGASTAPNPSGAKPWKFVDKNGARTNSGYFKLALHGHAPSKPRPLSREEIAR